MSTYPANLRYAKSHEWILLEGDVAIIGITDFAQSELGDVVYVELPEVGRALQAGEARPHHADGAAAAPLAEVELQLGGLQHPAQRRELQLVQAQARHLHR